jgi:hypothetical protein
MSEPSELVQFIGLGGAAAFALLILVLVGFRILKNFRRQGLITPAEYKMLRKLSWFVLLLASTPRFLQSVIDLFHLYSIGGMVWFSTIPLEVIAGIIETYIAILLFYRKYFDSPNNAGAGQLTHGTVLTDFVRRVFESSEFYTAFTSAIPSGKGDNGLEYVPMMIKDSNDRAKRFKSSSEKFLLTIVLLSLVFIATTIFFGWILLSEESVGVYKDFHELVSFTSESVKPILVNLKPDMVSDPIFKERFESKISALKRPYDFDLNTPALSIAYPLQSEITEFERSGNFDSLLISINVAIDSLRKLPEPPAKFLNVLQDFSSSLTDFSQQRMKAYEQMQIASVRIDSLTSKIDKQLHNDTNVQTDLIKRVALSLVVVTFFLAVLRYFRTLYQSHFEESLRAEEQELLIRKFYVALKNSEHNSTERKIALDRFLSSVPKEQNSERKIAKPAQSTESKMLAKIFDTLMKKI